MTCSRLQNVTKELHSLQKFVLSNLRLPTHLAADILWQLVEQVDAGHLCMSDQNVTQVVHTACCRTDRIFEQTPRQQKAATAGQRHSDHSGACTPTTSKLSSGAGMSSARPWMNLSSSPFCVAGARSRRQYFMFSRALAR